MGTDSNVAGDWAAAVHKAQADMLRQWTQLGQIGRASCRERV